MGATCSVSVLKAKRADQLLFSMYLFVQIHNAHLVCSVKLLNLPFYYSYIYVQSIDIGYGINVIILQCGDKQTLSHCQTVYSLTPVP